MATSADAVEIVVVHDDQQSQPPKRKPHSAKKANRLTDQDTAAGARRSSAKHPIATKALRCTATAWNLIVADSFAKF